MNPNRICGMCRMLHERGGPDPAPNRDALIAILNSDGFKAMREAANCCPACVLSVVRTLNYIDDEQGPMVAGPDDGRREWQYKKEKQEWWSEWNADQNQFGYGY